MFLPLGEKEASTLKVGYRGLMYRIVEGIQELEKVVGGQN